MLCREQLLYHWIYVRSHSISAYLTTVYLFEARDWFVESSQWKHSVITFCMYLHYIQLQTLFFVQCFLENRVSSLQRSRMRQYHMYSTLLKQVADTNTRSSSSSSSRRRRRRKLKRYKKQQNTHGLRGVDAGCTTSTRRLSVAITRSIRMTWLHGCKEQHTSHSGSKSLEIHRRAAAARNNDVYRAIVVRDRYFCGAQHLPAQQVCSHFGGRSSRAKSTRCLYSSGSSLQACPTWHRLHANQECAAEPVYECIPFVKSCLLLLSYSTENRWTLE